MIRHWVRRLFAAAVLVALPAASGAVEEITVLALTQDAAILRIDGARRVLRAGEVSPEGVRLVRADTAAAVIEYGGRRERLPLRAVLAPLDLSGEVPPRATLWADGDGFFFAEGRINGRPVRFLVDTGAATVALNSREARRLGIDYRRGRRGIAYTAGGVVRMYAVNLRSVSIGEITLHDVAAGVLEGDFPDVPLLGMTFLGRLEMKRDGQRMELIQKY